MNHSVKALRITLTAAVLSLSTVISAGALSAGVGTVTGDSLRLRAEASTDSAILTTAPKGAQAVVLEDTGSGWYKVVYEGSEGYMSAEYVTLSTDADADLGTGTLDTDGESLNLRAGPGTDYDKLASIPYGTTLTLTGITDGWYKTSYNGSTGYVSSDYVSLTAPASSAVAYASTSAVSSDLRSQVVSYAMQFLGRPYVYGASGSSSFDCSGFTSYVYRNFGYSLNRSAAGQYSNGTAIDQSQMQPGDLILWRAYGSSSTATHVGIYIGNDQYIHASSTGGQVTIDDMDYGSNARYVVGVRQILN